jgi:antitoxin ChpS
MNSTAIDPATSAAAGVFLKAVTARFPVTRALLFGSRARRNFGPESDADIAVILSGVPQSYARTKLSMADIAYDVLLETGVLIQPLPIWEDQWALPDTHCNPALLRTIAREGIPL